ncbi:RnfABCDGE type electron transport complex subunit D [Clostridium polynesiense]|uniref:RnfABCDGE type electron transport complex subunit D n=1 Tax=Clostridium polynesiense TaxID=1325933 RepID=UPI00058B78FC|nr:RnfABCDGE type electron transport complex subunit D [Clostridium polynesiense]
MDNKLFKVSSFPHIHSKRNVKTLMRDVLISLLPAVGVGIYYYKLDAVKLLLASVLAGVIAEVLWNKVVKGKFALEDCSSIITSIIITLILPSHVPLWLPAVGAVIAVLLVKQFFGGLGQNFVNPAATAKAFIIASWAGLLVKPASDAVSGASVSDYVPAIKDLFIGYAEGTIGEASILALIIGGIYLLVRGVIDGKATVSYLVSVALFSFIIGKDGFMTGDAVRGLMSGNIFIVGIFMVNDFASTPVNGIGKIIFGFMCGLLTVLFKVIGNNSDGAYYAVLVMNLFAPMIESLTISKGVKAVKEAI